jgi:putative ABC transport system permease protein
LAATPPPSAAPSAFRLGWRQLLRDFRAGELRLLVVAVMLAVAALTAVGFFADRIQGGLALGSRELLGGDALVSSDQPAPAAFAREAASRGLATATSAQFPSMARAPDAKGGATRLAAVKAVGEGYPLRGALTLRTADGRGSEKVAGGPPRGAVWVDTALLDALQLQPGDPLLLGDATLRIDRVIVLEPDRGTGFSAFAPRVLLSEADLPATGLVQPASRVSWRLAVAARGAVRDDVAVQGYVDWAEKQVQAGAVRGLRVESFSTGRPEMKQTLDRAEKFLNLVALLAALLAAVAVGIAARDFASRHLDDCAMLRVLGLPQRTIAGQYLVEFTVVGAIASVAGLAIGFAMHHGFLLLLRELILTELPPPSIWPALFGVGVGFTLLFGFGLPPVLQLARVPPLRVMRRDVGALKPASIAVLGAGAVGFAALLLAVSSDLKLGAIAVGGFAVAVVVFAALAWLALALLRRSVPEANAPRWLVLATRQIAARPAFAVLQVSALSVGLLALVLLAILRTDLIASWRQVTPKDAPDRFIINVQPPQADAFRQTLDAAGVRRYDWFPMVRGRLVTVGEKPVAVADYADERAKRLVDREFNLSWSGTLPAHNEVVGGRWTANEAGGLSVEEGIAQTLGLKLGDTLVFDLGGTTASGKITSLRKVDWSSMRVNFFVLFPQAAIPSTVPATYIAAFRAPATAGFDGALARDFPNITAIDVTASIAQVQRVLDQVVAAVEFLFAFTLAAGLVVLFAAITATREARAKEFAVMRALGASSKLLGQVQRAELLGVGALAGVLASGAAIAVSWCLARFVFEFPWSPSPIVPFAGAAAGAVLALAAGWWGLREVLRRPVVQTLRQAADV